MSLLASAAADLGVGAEPEVRVLRDGRLWLAELGTAVTAADVYQAGRGLVAAQLDAIADVSDRPVEDHALAWLVTLQTNEVMVGLEDRKSTRLNSSHANISYAVFCLKKKKHESKTIPGYV